MNVIKLKLSFASLETRTHSLNFFVECSGGVGVGQSGIQ